MSSALPPEFSRFPDSPSADAPPGLPSPDRLVRALVTAAGMRADDTLVHREGELHGAIREYVQALKGAGMPPEAVVVAVKGVARRAGLPHFGIPEDTLLIERTVSWCIEEYYRTP